MSCSSSRRWSPRRTRWRRLHGSKPRVPGVPLVRLPDPCGLAQSRRAVRPFVHTRRGRARRTGGAGGGHGLVPPRVPGLTMWHPTPPSARTGGRGLPLHVHLGAGPHLSLIHISEPTRRTPI
eukprot:35346-Pleurochrysis_carterae.AAC.1